MSAPANTLFSFYQAVLQQLGAPVTQTNLDALAAIIGTEGPNLYNNPLNIEWHTGDNKVEKGTGSFTGQYAPGDWNGPPYDVQEYATPDQGVAATVAFLNQPHWKGVKTALVQNQGYQNIINELTQAYTWAPFKQVSESQAQQYLTDPLSGTVNLSPQWLSKSGKSIGPPPINPPYTNGTTGTDRYTVSVNTNLSDAQLEAMQTWYNKYFDDGSYPATNFTAPFGAAAPGYNGTKEQIIVGRYDLAISGSYSNTAPPDPGAAQAGIGPVTGSFGLTDLIKIVGKILTWLSSAKNWERIGLYILGAMLLIFAADYAFKGTE